MFSPKKLLIIAVIVILLIAIPLTLYLLQQQQEVRSHAQAASTLSFAPDSSTSAPIQAKVNDPVDLDLYVDPSSNLVSIVRLEIQYDSTKLATISGTSPKAFENNATAFPSILEGPVYKDGKVDVTLSIGSDPTKAISVKTKIGTIHFTALSTTTTPTQVIYSTTETKVLSLAGPGTGSSDQASENVLSSTTPAIVDIVGPTEPTVTPTPDVTDTPTPEVTDTPTPTVSTAPNQTPVCTTLTATPSAGTAPLDVVFTANGSDPDGSISKYSFNFGDGSLSTVTSDANVSSNSATAEHTYSSGGSFTASVVMTDNAGGTSTNSCSQLISVDGPAATPAASITPTSTATPTAGIDTPTPTLPSPGPGATIIGLGAFFSVLSVIGAVLFFAL